MLGQPTDGMLRQQRGVDSKADVAAAYLIGSRWGLPGRVLQSCGLCTTQRLYPSGRWGLASRFSEGGVAAAYEGWVSHHSIQSGGPLLPIGNNKVTTMRQRQVETAW